LSGGREVDREKYPVKIPPGYFWDGSRTDGMALGQTWRPDRMGAWVKIEATSASCDGTTLITKFNNGDQTATENAPRCVQLANGGGNGVGGQGQGGYLGTDGQLHLSPTDSSPPCSCTRQLGETSERSGNPAPPTPPSDNSDSENPGPAGGQSE